MVCVRCSVCVMCVIVFFFFKQKTAYEMRISDWSSDVCSSDLRPRQVGPAAIRLPASERLVMTTPDLSTPRDLIAFLDFDGVISSPRAYVVQPELPRDHRWIDPVSCKMIAKLQSDYGFQIVISSTWRGFGRDKIGRAHV